MSGLFSYLAKPISILFGGTGGATKAAAQSSLDIQVATGSIDGISRGVGIVGEFSSASVASSAVSLTSGVTANLTSVSLPAGKYLVFGCVTFAPAATTSVTHLGVGSSQVSASLARGLTAKSFMARLASFPAVHDHAI